MHCYKKHFSSLQLATQHRFQLYKLEEKSLRVTLLMLATVIALQVTQQLAYRKPPNISPGLIFVRKHFLLGLYMGGGLIYGGLTHRQDFVLVILTIY